jgi:hypothetical protein
MVRVGGSLFMFVFMFVCVLHVAMLELGGLEYININISPQGRRRWVVSFAHAYGSTSTPKLLLLYE